MASSKRTTSKKKPVRGKKPKTSPPRSAAKARAARGKAGKVKVATKAPRGKARRPTPRRTKAQARGVEATIQPDAVDRALKAAEVEGYMARLPPPLQPMVQRLRAILLESAPEAIEFLEHETPSYFAGGVFARIEPTEREVLVRFLRGGSLPSSSELGGSGEERTIALASLEEVRAEVLKKLVREAVSFNLSSGAEAKAQA